MGQPEQEPRWIVETEEHRNLVRKQLRRLLGAAQFRNSRRYPAFLQFVVEETLKGNESGLKERTVGIWIFDRSPDYDTNADPIVRVTAGEIRKRIAQYYQEQSHGDELRIELPLGSYVPVFRHPQGTSFREIESAAVVPTTPEIEPGLRLLTEKPPKHETLETRLHRIAFVVLFAGAALCLATVAVRWPRTNDLDRFWAPAKSGSGPVFICMAEINGPPPDDSELTLEQHVKRADLVTFSDAAAGAQIVRFLESRGAKTRLTSESATTITDLRANPSVLIGAFDNPWTMRAVSQLSFQFVHPEGTTVISIEDRKDPSHRRWSVDLSEPYSKLTQDYAIVARFHDSTTDQVTYIAAGLEASGTSSASEVLTNPKLFRLLARAASPGWESKNIEAVIGTQVVNGNTGSPTIVAVYCW
jgi:hypothetical protein